MLLKAASPYRTKCQRPRLPTQSASDLPGRPGSSALTLHDRERQKERTRFHSSIAIRELVERGDIIRLYEEEPAVDGHCDACAAHHPGFEDIHWYRQQKQQDPSFNCGCGVTGNEGKARDSRGIRGNLAPFHCHRRNAAETKAPKMSGTKTCADTQGYSPPAHVRPSCSDGRDRSSFLQRCGC